MGSIKDAYNGIEGAKIVRIREMTSKEAAEQWILDQFYSGNVNYTGDVEVDDGKH